MDFKIKNLIQLLEFKTLSKNAIWSRTSSDNEFKIEFNNATITIDNWFVDGMPHYDFVILNENGDAVERITVNDKDKLTEDYPIITRLYNNVKDNYFKVDETINNILFELNSNTKIGGSKIK